eukprot:scaffold16302_cov136-Isochrysis_galbana.AAC.4
MAARKETEKSQQQAINQRQRIAPRLHSAFTHASSKRVFCMCGLHQVARVAGAVTNRKAAQPPIHQHRHRTLPSTPARSLRRCEWTTGRSYLGCCASPAAWGAAVGVKILNCGAGGRSGAAEGGAAPPGASSSAAPALKVSTYLDRGFRRAEPRGEKRAGSGIGVCGAAPVAPWPAPIGPAPAPTEGPPMPPVGGGGGAERFSFAHSSGSWSPGIHALYFSLYLISHLSSSCVSFLPGISCACARRGERGVSSRKRPASGGDGRGEFPARRLTTPSHTRAAGSTDLASGHSPSAG